MSEKIRKHNKKPLKIALGVTSGAIVAGLATGLAVYFVNQNKESYRTIPVEYLKFSNGKITGYDTSKDLSRYNTLAIPESVNGTAITGVAANAFKDAFKSTKNSTSTITRINIGKNITSIEGSAFEGCDAVETIDFSAIQNDEAIGTLASKNIAYKSFKISNAKSQGNMIFSDKISSGYSNFVKGAMVDCGLPLYWYKKEQQPTFSDMKMKGVETTQLSTKQYRSKTDTQQIQSTYTSEELNVTYSCSWKIELSEGMPEGCITANKVGTDDNCYVQLQWNGKIPAGKHGFTLIGTYLKEGETETTLKVSQEFTIDVTEVKLKIAGDNQISAKDYTSGTWANAYSIGLEGDTYEESSLKSLKVINDATGDITIDKTTKKVSWGSKIAAGPHSFDIEANYDIEGNTLTQTFNVNMQVTERSVSVTIPAAMPTTISELTKGICEGQFTCQVNNTNEAAKWTLQNAGTTDISHFHLDESSGKFSWDEGVEAGEYKFKAKATVSAGAGVWVGYSDVFTINVNAYDSTIEGSNVLSSKDYTSGTETGTPRQLMINKSIAVTEGVTWELNGAPEGVSINSNTGVISWNDKIPASTYTFNVKAKALYKGVEREATQAITFNVTPRIFNVTGGSTTLSGVEDDAKSDTQLWTAETAQSTDTVTWKLVSATQASLPSGLKIVNDVNEGKVTWSDLPAGEYKFYVKAIINGHWYGQSQDVVTLKINKKKLEVSQSGASSVDTKDYHAGESATTWTVKFNGVDITSSDNLSWKLTSTTGSELPSSIKMNKSGKIEWGKDLMAGAYTFTLTALYNYKGEIREAAVASAFTISVTETVVTINYDKDSQTQFIGSQGAAGKSEGKFSVEVDGKKVEPTELTWHFTTKEGSAVFPTGQISIDNNGQLNWGKELEVDTSYKFYIWVEVENWWGYYKASGTGVEFTLTIQKAHNLTYDDLLLDSDNNVIGLKTDISGYGSFRPTLTIDIGTGAKKVAGISQFKNVPSESLIKELDINTDIDYDLTGKNIQLTNIEKISVKAATGKIITLDATTTSFFKESLQTVELKNAKIAEKAFYNFQTLKLLKLEGCEKLVIGKQAFAETRNNQFLVWGSSNIFQATTELGESAFENSLVMFGTSENENASGEYTVYNNVPKACFKGCTYLELYLTLAAGSTISDEAFRNSSIKELIIPEDATNVTIGKYAFADCGYLSHITFNTKISKIDDNAFDSTKFNVLTVYDAAEIEEANVKLADTEGDNIFNNLVATSFSTVKCQSAKSVMKWYYKLQALNAAFADFAYEPTGAIGKLTYDVEAGEFNFTNKPTYVVLEHEVKITWNLIHSTEHMVNRVDSYVKYKGTKYLWGSTDTVIFNENSITIPADKVDAEAINQGIEICLLAQPIRSIEWTGIKHAFLAEELVAGNNKFANLGTFTVNDGFSFGDEYEIASANVYEKDGTTPISKEDRAKIHFSTINPDRLTFQVQIEVDRSLAEKHYIVDFTIRNNKSGQTFFFDGGADKIHLYVDYQWTKLDNKDFNIDSTSNTITGLKTQLKNNVYYKIDLTLADYSVGTEYYANKIADTAFKNITNADMIDTLNITINNENADSITFGQNSLSELTWVHHISIINNSTWHFTLFKHFLLPFEEFQQEKFNEHLYDVTLKNVEVFDDAFAGFTQLKTAKIDKGCELRDRAFYRCFNLYEVDFSDWGTELMSDAYKNWFVQCGGWTTKTRYFYCAAGAEDLWMNHLNQVHSAEFVTKPTEYQESGIWFIKAK